ncbi:hypothetical protein OAF98_00770 [Planctomicrobium sp.]|jgi:hypothetical protein|nr:hypothetical protein [Planctomicrobium sp.]MBT5019145.1 hypothetical protein [Planctomicrobium sp.]MDB4731487.1 hypothetical protein [bacterium]MDB4742991.1 hypothetical protein [Planctomicrobium sp.]
MPITQSAQDIFERQFLEMRCGLLTLAAARDRISRADGAEAVANDGRMQQLEEAIKIVASEGDDRAERLQLLFSDQYVENWNQ